MRPTPQIYTPVSDTLSEINARRFTQVSDTLSEINARRFTPLSDSTNVSDLFTWYPPHGTSVGDHFNSSYYLPRAQPNTSTRIEMWPLQPHGWNRKKRARIDGMIELYTMVFLSRLPRKYCKETQLSPHYSQEITKAGKLVTPIVRFQPRKIAFCCSHPSTHKKGDLYKVQREVWLWNRKKKSV